MRIIVDDINHTVQVYSYYNVEGEMVEASKTYVRRQPVIAHDNTTVSIEHHPRVGGRLRVTVDDTVYEDVVDLNQGGQDLLAKLATQITLDEGNNVTAEIDSRNEGAKIVLLVNGGTIENVEQENLNHPPLPAHVEEALHRHIKGY